MSSSHKNCVHICDSMTLFKYFLQVFDFVIKICLCTLENFYIFSYDFCLWINY